MFFDDGLDSQSCDTPDSSRLSNPYDIPRPNKESDKQDQKTATGKEELTLHHCSIHPTNKEVL
jgi:hypothetical protein